MNMNNVTEQNVTNDEVKKKKKQQQKSCSKHACDGGRKKSRSQKHACQPNTLYAIANIVTHSAAAKNLCLIFMHMRARARFIRQI